MECGRAPALPPERAEPGRQAVEENSLFQPGKVRDGEGVPPLRERLLFVPGDPEVLQVLELDTATFS